MSTPHIFELFDQLIKNYTDDTYNAFTKELDQLEDINIKHQDNTLLTLAAYHQNTQLIKLLLEKGADINISTDNSNYSPLIYALFRKGLRLIAKTDHVYELLKHKPNLDLQDHVGDTALMVACWGIHDVDDDIALTLIEMGADINIEKPSKIIRCPDNITGTAFTILCDKKGFPNHLLKLQTKLISMSAHLNRIHANGAGHELFTACENNNIYLAEELLKAGANINHKCYTCGFISPLTTTAELIVTQKSLHCLIDYFDDSIYSNANTALIDTAIQHKCYKFIEQYIRKNNLGYSDVFINKLISHKCDVIIKQLKRDIFSSLFLILNKRSINKHIGYKIIDLICGA
jgi:ankyrin repeat protein